MRMSCIQDMRLGSRVPMSPRLMKVKSAGRARTGARPEHRPAEKDNHDQRYEQEASH